jgi:hypothetical protein
METGILTTVTGEQIAFRDLTWLDDKAYYVNAKTSENEDLFDNSIQSMEEVPSDDPRYIAIAPPLPQRESSDDDIRYKSDYPEGVYVTREDFINKKPTKKDVIFKSLYGLTKKVIEPGEEDNCFIFTLDNKKLKKVFAVSKNGNLYFNVKAILKNNEKDKSQESDFPNSYTRVILGGNNYLFMKTALANTWRKSFGYGLGGVVGGTIASTADREKGVVWDFKNQRFDIFKNCNDFNKFLQSINFNKEISCGSDAKHGYLQFSSTQRILNEIK